MDLDDIQDLRRVGIDIACYLADNERLDYPIKVFKHKPPKNFDRRIDLLKNSPPSADDPNQGCGGCEDDE